MGSEDAAEFRGLHATQLIATYAYLTRARGQFCIWFHEKPLASQHRAFQLTTFVTVNSAADASFSAGAFELWQR